MFAMFAFNRPFTNSQKKDAKFMCGMKINRGKCWFDAKQTAKGRLQMAIYQNIEDRLGMPWLKPISQCVI